MCARKYIYRPSPSFHWIPSSTRADAAIGGVYLAPCSGGKNNLYTVDVRAMQGNSEVNVQLGHY
ncbi:MAG: hypothetical protein HOI95_09765 [Chromatiales bacterium]|nr:hypothetical protein [Chromatiales bacterium]